jgi:hypothetical protein
MQRNDNSLQTDLAAWDNVRHTAGKNAARVRKTLHAW